MGIVINGNVGNIQNNEGISMANQNNILFYTESDSTLNPQSIQQDVNQIKEKVVAGEFDGYFEGENDELEALFEKVQYGFNSAKRSNVVKEKEVLELLSKVEVDLRELAHESKTDKKKITILWYAIKGFTNLLDIRQRTKAVALVKRCSGFY